MKEHGKPSSGEPVCEPKALDTSKFQKQISRRSKAVSLHFLVKRGAADAQLLGGAGATVAEVGQHTPHQAALGRLAEATERIVGDNGSRLGRCLTYP
jgi:hypothetical protein